MTRVDFITRLKRGLVGLSTTAAAEIVADYEAHFDAGAAEGRTEAEVAEALGDPDRLARELRAEAGARAWNQQPGASSAAGAVFAIIGLGAIDILILLPIVLPLFGSLVAVLLSGFAVFLSGGFVAVAGPFLSPPGGPFVALLGGIGVMGVGIFMTALCAVFVKWLIDATVWYARLHYRVLKPALDQGRI